MLSVSHSRFVFPAQTGIWRRNYTCEHKSVRFPAISGPLAGLTHYGTNCNDDCVDHDWSRYDIQIIDLLTI